MKKIIFAALCVAGSATSANAAVTVSQTAGSSTYAGPTPTYTFSPTSRPVTTGGSFYEQDMAADSQPLGGTGGFYSVNGYNGPGTISLAGFGAISSLSFIWGSVDAYNTLSFLDAVGNTIYSVTGTQLLGSAANGDQSASTTNPVVTFAFTGQDRNVASMRLNSTGDSFEIDNLAISPVPEPATWGMMLLGLGLAGGSLRRRRASTVRAATA